MRSKSEIYPDYSAELEALRNSGITKELLERIIRKHQPNANYNQNLYERYQCLDTCVPIFNRSPRYSDSGEPINNKINNDFFGKIIDFKTGYFAGKPITYGYSFTEESEDMTGGEEFVDEASKALSDFVTRNSMYDKDMEMTKHASTYGYVGRLFYVDKERNERCAIFPGFETIVLSDTNLAEPEFAVRYYRTTDIDDKEVWKVEFYDNKYIYYWEGALNNLAESKPPKLHLFDYCPLQIIVNNDEMLGDAEKVLSLIDDYDRSLSDNANDIEAFSQAYMVFENVILKDEEMQKAQSSGAIQFNTGPNGGKVYYLTKDVNDAFSEHHLDRLESQIYYLSETPNMKDDSFGTASGIALKFKILGFEAKCGRFQAKVDVAGQYMFKVLGSSWAHRGIAFDPLQAYLDYNPNFPRDLVGEAQGVQALINAGYPKRAAFEELSFVDDVDYIMDLIEEEKGGIAPLEGEEPEEMTKLNGVQTTLVLNAVAKVQSGEYTLEEAIDMIRRATGMSEQEVRNMTIMKRILPDEVLEGVE